MVPRYKGLIIVFPGACLKNSEASRTKLKRVIQGQNNIVSNRHCSSLLPLTLQIRLKGRERNYEMSASQSIQNTNCKSYLHEDYYPREIRIESHVSRSQQKTNTSQPCLSREKQWAQGEPGTFLINTEVKETQRWGRGNKTGERTREKENTKRTDKERPREQGRVGDENIRNRQRERERERERAEIRKIREEAKKIETERGKHWSTKRPSPRVFASNSAPRQASFRSKSLQIRFSLVCNFN